MKKIIQAPFLFVIFGSTFLIMAGMHAYNSIKEYTSHYLKYTVFPLLILSIVMLGDRSNTVTTNENGLIVTRTYVGKNVTRTAITDKDRTFSMNY
jgi:hypothetical protein